MDRHKYTREEVAECEMTALYRTIGYLEKLKENDLNSFGEKEVALAEKLLNLISNALAPVAKFGE